jgi:hypothetical protein
LIEGIPVPRINPRTPINPANVTGGAGDPT